MNDIVTSSPKFVQMMKLLSMGPDNVYVAAVLEAAGVKTIEDIGSLSKPEQKKILAAMLTGKSALARELSAVKGETDDLVDQVIESLYNAARGVTDSVGLTNRGIEATEPKAKPGRQQKKPAYRGGRYGGHQP